jgi:hypothetical protein
MSPVYLPYISAISPPYQADLAAYPAGRLDESAHPLDLTLSLSLALILALTLTLTLTLTPTLTLALTP